jgi:hypothetical protein
VRKAVATMGILLTSCAGQHTIIQNEGRSPESAGELVKESTERKGQAGQERASSPKKEEIEPSPATPDGAGKQATAWGGSPPGPAEVEGEVFAHCAYGQPNYGENPTTDAKEEFAVVMLDKTLPEVCPTEPGSDCVQEVAMFTVGTLSEAGVPYPKSLVGRRVRFKVSEYATAETGHHHSRILLWYSEIADLGPATRRSLRPLWSRVKGDFLGVSCKGYPQ